MAISHKTPPPHGAALAEDTRDRVKVAGNFAARGLRSRLMAEDERTDGEGRQL